MKRTAFALAFVLGAVAPAMADDSEDCANLSGEQAIAACDRVINSHKVRGEDLAKIYFYRGIEFAQKGDTDKALADFEQSADISPKSAAVFQAIGQGYRFKGNLDRAVEAYTEAITIEPDEPNNHFYRAAVLLEQGKFDAAVDDYSAAIDLDPEDGDFYNARGVATETAGDLDTAIDDYTTAIEKKPDFAIAFANRGDARLQQGAMADAIADYSKAIELAPDDPINVYKRGNAYRRGHQYDLALEDYARLIALAPEDSDVRYERGTTRILAHDLDGAIEDLTEAIRLSPGNAPAFQMRGFAHQVKSEMNDAVADYSAAIRLDPENPERYLMRAWVSHLAGHDQLALADADAALALNPDLVSVHSTRAAILKALGEVSAAADESTAAKEAAVHRHQAEEAAREQASVAEQARQKARGRVEEAFLAAYDKSHPYAYPLERTAAALGHSFGDDQIEEYNERLTDEGRKALAEFQRRSGLRGTGYLDERTFNALLDEPVEPDQFEVDLPWSVPAEPVGDWFFSSSTNTNWCTIWTKPTSIIGRFAPNFGKLPLFEISRDRTDRGNNLSQTYADADLYAEDATVVVETDTTFETESNGGGFGPKTTCKDTGCFGSGDILKAVRAAQTFDVVGESALGEKLILTYSAVGFTKAYQRLDRECGRGRLGDWLR